MMFRVITLLLLSSCSFANVIYGIDNIHNYRFHTQKHVYVQVGSFTSLTRATQLQTNIKVKTKQHAIIKHQKGTYRVLAGPFYDASSLNYFAAHFAAPIQKPKVLHKKNIVTTSTQVRHPPTLNTKQPQTHTIIHQDSKTISSYSAPSNGWFSRGRWFLGGELGAQSMDANSTMTVDNGSEFPHPNNLDSYSVQGGSDYNPLGGLYIGRRWDVDYRWVSAYSLALQYQYLSSSKVHGQITQYSIPQFLNYDYTWKLASHLLVVNGKVNLMEWHHFSPFVNAGVGIAFNQTRNYSENPLPEVTPRISPSFQENSNTSFAYILGLGMDYALNSNLLFHVGYQYSNLGSTASAQGQNTWSSQHLHLDKHYSNAFIIGGTYLMDDTFHFTSLRPFK